MKTYALPIPSFFNGHNAPGYTPPEHFPMFLAQHLHNAWLYDRISYKNYLRLKKLAYWLLTFRVC